MKLQVTPQALRLRLADDELHTLDQAGQLTHTLDFGAGQRLTYALRQLPATDPATGPRAHYAADVLTLEIPATLAKQLIEGTAISLRGEVAGTEGQLLRILVEKDLGPSH